MHAVTLAEAKERLGELLDEAIAGEEVTIAREGSPAVRLVAVDAMYAERPPRRIDVDRLKRMTDAMGPPPPEPEGGWVGNWRDQERY